jgi:hypothetical protein
MTRKDYERIADAMKRAYWQTGSKDMISYMTYVQNLAVEFRKDNPKFTPHKFYEACGLLPRQAYEEEV